jgi:hypothetical protein
MRYCFTYEKDGVVTTAHATVHETAPESGKFWAESPEAGKGPVCDNVSHWKPIKAALLALVGGGRMLRYALAVPEYDE